MEKRLILAVLLITFVLIFFSVINTPKPQKEKIEESEEKIENLLSNAVFKPEKSAEIVIDSPLYSVVISGKGGIKSFRLNEYKTRDAGIAKLQQQLEKTQEQFRKQSKIYGADENSPLLYSIQKTRYEISHLKESDNEKGVELISFSELYHGSLPPFLQIKDKNEKLIWAETGSYKLSNPEPNKVLLIQEIPNLIVIKKEFSFPPAPDTGGRAGDPNSYVINVKVIVENIGNETLENKDFLITCGPDVGIEEGIRAFTKFEPIVFNNDQIKRKHFGRGSQNKNSEKTEYGRIDWVALQDKYFTKILIPEEAVKSAYLHKSEQGEYTAGLKTAIPTLEPSKMNEFSFNMYLGPKKLEQLYRVDKQASKIVDYGLFGNLFQIVHILKFFHKLTKNYGIAIILLTVMINVILFPLSLKSFKSMKEMRKLQPEMEKIRKEFKDDPQRMNMEVMELYKRHKVNPAGGCLPMLLQLPIFIGLFVTLRTVIELRGAPFVLWIKDLSLPDALPLPFNVPYIGSAMNILPILMTAATFLQQKFSGTAAGSSQSMMWIFPVVMLFIFYNFPSGLVLYFLCSNVFTILSQIWINRPELKKI